MLPAMTGWTARFVCTFWISRAFMSRVAPERVGDSLAILLEGEELLGLLMLALDLLLQVGRRPARRGGAGAGGRRPS